MATPPREPGPETAPEGAALVAGAGTARVPGAAPSPQDAARPKRGGVFGRGDPFIWLTGSALGTCLLMILGLVVVILTNGLGFFWPAPARLQSQDGRERSSHQPTRDAARRSTARRPMPATASSHPTTPR